MFGISSSFRHTTLTKRFPPNEVHFIGGCVGGGGGGGGAPVLRQCVLKYVPP